MKTTYLGIDVSKGYADFTMIDEQKNVLEENFQLDDTQEGHRKLLEILYSLREKHQIDQIKAALESTGGYENNWLTLLKQVDDLNIKMAHLNPYGIKHDIQAKMQRTLTDSVSAKHIAEYVLRYPDKINYEEAAYNVFDSLKSQYNYISTLIKQKTQLLNQLEKHLYSVFPELLPYCQDGMPNWVMYLLCEFPTANSVREASKEQIQRIKYISERKARMIKNKAEKSVSKINDVVIHDLVKHIASDIIWRTQFIATLKKQLEKQAGTEALVQLLCSFRGIGAYSAVGILIEIEDINRFPSSKKICSYFGLHPIYKKSGDGTIYIGMSKKGAGEIRGILYMVVRSAIVYNPHIKRLYERYLSRGLNKTQVIGILMHKILRIIYGMLKNNTPYDPNYDLACQEKSMSCKKQNYEKRRFRYSNWEEDAPISKRQAKKRKEQNIAPNFLD
jgi:transposase